MSSSQTVFFFFLNQDENKRFFSQGLELTTTGYLNKDPRPVLSLYSLPETLIEVPASMIPLFGRTQYRRGAVVFTLKHTFLSVGLESLRVVVTTSENGPENGEGRH